MHQETFSPADIEVFVGIDMAKGDHYVQAVSSVGDGLVDRPVAYGGDVDTVATIALAAASWSVDYDAAYQPPSSTGSRAAPTDEPSSRNRTGSWSCSSHSRRNSRHRLRVR